jgi:hypothetical protein
LKTSSQRPSGPAHRLVAAVQVDDGQAAEADLERAVDGQPVVVRPAVTERGGHRRHVGAGRRPGTRRGQLQA